MDLRYVIYLGQVYFYMLLIRNIYSFGLLDIDKIIDLMYLMYLRQVQL